MGFKSASEKQQFEAGLAEHVGKEQAETEAARTRLAAKIVMVMVDRIVNEIIRPGPTPEERECYDMAGELRAMVPKLEALAKSIIDVNKGCV